MPQRKTRSAHRGSSRARTPQRKSAIGRSPKKGKKGTASRTPKRKIAYVQRPARWWREPQANNAELRDRLDGLPQDERDFLIHQERAYLVAKIQEDIKTLRKFSSDFDHYSLDSKHIVRMHPAQTKKVFDSITKLRRAQSHPAVEFKPKSDKQVRAAIDAGAGKLFPNQRVFLIHNVDAKGARAEYKDGIVQIVHETRGTKIRQGFFPFVPKPRTWNKLIATARKMIPKLPDGFYRIYTSLYGGVGDSVEKELLIKELQSFYGQYNDYMSQQVLGFIFVASESEATHRKMRRQITTAEKIRNQNRMDRREAMKALRARAKKVTLENILFRVIVIDEDGFVIYSSEHKSEEVAKRRAHAYKKKFPQYTVQIEMIPR